MVMILGGASNGPMQLKLTTTSSILKKAAGLDNLFTS